MGLGKFGVTNGGKTGAIALATLFFSIASTVQAEWENTASPYDCGRLFSSEIQYGPFSDSPDAPDDSAAYLLCTQYEVYAQVRDISQTHTYNGTTLDQARTPVTFQFTTSARNYKIPHCYVDNSIPDYPRIIIGGYVWKTIPAAPTTLAHEEMLERGYRPHEAPCIVDDWPEPNQPPAVGARANPATLHLPTLSTTLIGMAFDDGKPTPPGQMTFQWTKVSGPGSVSLSNENALQTNAQFSSEGTYVMRFTANDSQLSSSADVTIRILPRNDAPTVNAGANQTIILGTLASLNGSASDDGNPNPPATLTFSWTKQSGPGEVTFSNPTALRTTASFSALGTHVLDLMADDSERTANSQVTIEVVEPATISAGPDQSVIYPQNISLDGTATPRLTAILWSKISGPGTVTLSNPRAIDTTASFSAPGTYVLEIRGLDPISNQLLTDRMTATVSPNQAPVANAGPNQRVAYPSTVILVGSATDDGVPGPLTITWRKSSGLGNLTFRDAHALSTQVDADQPGIYRIELEVSDGLLTGRSSLTVELYEPANRAPVVSASPALQTVNFGDAATFTYTITDDGKPAIPGMTTHSWTKLSGRGDVQFTDQFNGQASATFSMPDDYTVQLIADDGQLRTTKNLIVSVMPPAPVVNAGPDQTIALPAAANLHGTAEWADTHEWSKVSGPGDVRFYDPRPLDNTARINAPGVYVLRLTARNRTATVSDDITITVNPGPVNEPPVVNAGEDQTLQLPGVATLHGTATDDGLPTDPGTLTTTWVYVSGPGYPRIANPRSLDTTVSFPDQGVFTLRLVGNDGAATASDDIQITVVRANQAPQLRAIPNQTGTAGVPVRLAYTLFDDGLPTPPGRVTLTWRKIQGGGTVEFLNSDTAVFSAPDTYLLEAVASDGELEVTDQAFYTINGVPQPPNEAPVVYAGPDRSIVFDWNDYPWTATMESATVTDDGNPNPPAACSVTWSLVSGPATVTFDDPHKLHAKVTIVTGGTYRFRLTGDDSARSASSEVTITFLWPPRVNAGPDKNTMVNGTVTLDGSAVDGQFPPQLSYEWTKVSGPGDVAFGDPRQAVTTATFPELGRYVLRLTARHDDQSGFDDMEVVVDENQAPIVDAGPDQTVSPWQSYAYIKGTVRDDNRPDPALLTTKWKKISGPGSVSFTDDQKLETFAQFSGPGVYVLELEADDSLKKGSDQVQITVPEPPAGPENTPPVVDAGQDKKLPRPGNTDLAGTVTDDGLPSDQLSFKWIFVDGPTAIQFTDPHSLTTSAFFPLSGKYRLRLRASDSQLQAEDEMQVFVGPDGGGGSKDISAPGKGKTLFPPGAQAYVTYELDQPTRVEIKIFDSNGDLVSERDHDGQRGSNQVPVNRSELSSGIYVIHIHKGDGVETRKMALIN